VDAVVQAIEAGAGLVYLTDPNNPTGLGIPRAALEAIGEAATDTLVLIDEAYADFSGRTSLDLLARFRNLAIGRTFAKAHGLAGLRIGALVAHPDTLAPLRRILPPFTLNICAVRALPAALEDSAFLQASVASATRSKALIYEFCRRHGFTCWPSEANFVLVRVGAGAAAIVRAMGDRGILIRDRSDQPGCDGCIRITAGAVEHTETCLAALEAIVATRKD
jgi:histidinol-phosphate aminotransferase